MLEAVGYFALGLVLLALGGDSIVKGAAGLSQRFGASPFMAGLLLVAFGTSLPELAVNARAFAAGAQDLALGNAVGSNLANIGLTLGVAALVAPLHARMRLLGPWLVLLAVATLALIAFGMDGAVSRVEGLVLLAGFGVAVGLMLGRARLEEASVRDKVAAYARTSDRLGLNLLRFGIAVALLYFGARFVVQAAPLLGSAWGWSPLLVGLLPVAIGTALPEVAAAAAAARRGQGDMVAGHVIGSSLFNLLVVVGGMAALRPMPVPDSFVQLELPVALGFAALLYPMLRGDLRISRAEGGLLLGAFALWVAFEVWMI